MGVRTELLLAGDPALTNLSAAMEAAALWPAQIEHEVDWIASGNHGRKNVAGVLALHQDDRLAAYVPFRYRRDGLVVRVAGKKVARLPCRLVQLFGAGVICHDDDLVPEALAALEALPWRFEALNLWDLPTDCAFWRAIETGRASRFRRIERNRQHRHLIDLPDTMDAYLARFPRKSRGNLRRQATQLEAALGPMVLRIYRRPEEVPALLETVSSVYLETYHHHLLGENLTPVNASLVSNLTRSAERGWLRAYVLFAGGRPVAYLIGHLVRRRLTYETPGYTPQLAAQSPGVLLLLQIIEDLIQSRAADVLDFGPGDADYKRRFATRSYLEVSALLVRPTAYAHAMTALYGGLNRASALGGRLLARYHMKERVKTWLRQRRRPAP